MPALLKSVPPSVGIRAEGKLRNYCLDLVSDTLGEILLLTEAKQFDCR